jgi:hypothetical protein
MRFRGSNDGPLNEGKSEDPLRFPGLVGELTGSGWNREILVRLVSDWAAAAGGGDSLLLLS